MDNKRIALLVSGNAEDLKGGLNDLSSIFHVLKKNSIGNCDPKDSAFLLNCKTRNQFNDWINKNLKNWLPSNQLVFYYSGHGVMINQEFAFIFNDEENNSSVVLFTNFIKELNTIYKIKNVLFIIDACHSGAITNTDSSKSFSTELVLPLEVPKGVAYISSSSNEMQRSYENKNTNSSVFSELFIEGLESGLDGRPTHNGLIGIEDIVSYINNKLQGQEYRQYNQKAKAMIGNFTDYFWIAKNISGKVETNILPESQVLLKTEKYNQNIPFLEQSVPECDLTELDIKLVNEYYKKYYKTEEEIEDIFSLLRKLNLVNDAINTQKLAIKVYPIICFHKYPEAYFPMLRTRITRKSGVRTTIGGNISSQVAQILEFANEDLQFSLLDVKGQLHETNFQGSEAFSVVRELLSNAFAHRDYEQNGSIKILLSEDSITISNPGNIYVSWEDLLSHAYNNISHPVNIHINEIMYNLGLFEGFGRGLLSVKRFTDIFGGKAISFKKDINDDISITVKTTNSIFRLPFKDESLIDFKNFTLQPEFNTLSGPTILFLGPIDVGKTVAILRLSKYLRKAGYNIAIDEKFRSDEYYKSTMEEFERQLQSPNSTPPRTSVMGSVILNVYEKAKLICQLVDIPGEHVFDSQNPGSFSFPPYFKRIINSEKKKVFILLFESNMFNSSILREKYKNKILDLLGSYFQPKNDTLIIMYNKVDSFHTAFVNGDVDIKSVQNSLFNESGFEDFSERLNKKGIRKIAFLTFSSGYFIDQELYTMSLDKYPMQLWNTIMSNLKKSWFRWF